MVQLFKRQYNINTAKEVPTHSMMAAVALDLTLTVNGPGAWLRAVGLNIYEFFLSYIYVTVAEKM